LAKHQDFESVGIKLSQHTATRIRRHRSQT
jgi:hypothetical protein